MPLGIVSDTDFDFEVDKLEKPTVNQREESKSVPITTIVDMPNKGRGEGNVEVPNSLRTLIGQTSITDGRPDAIELAKSFGISPSSASAYANGSNSTTTYDDRPNADVINSAKQRVSKRARAKLMLALSKLTDDKMNEAKARDLAGIAKDMSVVMRGMEEDNNNPLKGNNGPTFIFYSPQFRKEEHFDVVQSKE